MTTLGPRRLTWMFFWICLVGYSLGCQSLTSGTKTNKPIDFAPGSETVVVQIRPSGRKPTNETVALKPNMRLQQILDELKVPFRNKLVHIARTSPSTGEPHKLEAVFGQNRRISLETDYAIQPGDRIVIAQDTTTSFDRVMKSLLGRS